VGWPTVAGTAAVDCADDHDGMAAGAGTVAVGSAIRWGAAAGTVESSVAIVDTQSRSDDL
jgi:hypothetical protein